MKLSGPMSPAHRLAMRDTEGFSASFDLHKGCKEVCGKLYTKNPSQHPHERARGAEVEFACSFPLHLGVDSVLPRKGTNTGAAGREEL